MLTAEGDIDGYGRVFLTYNFEGVHGLTDLGHFTGQIRSVTADGIMFGTLNGVYRMKSGKDAHPYLSTLTPMETLSWR